jgi:hypothetical protein
MHSSHYDVFICHSNPCHKSNSSLKSNQLNVPSLQFIFTPIDRRSCEKSFIRFIDAFSCQQRVRHRGQLFDNKFFSAFSLPFSSWNLFRFSLIAEQSQVSSAFRTILYLLSQFIVYLLSYFQFDLHLFISQSLIYFQLLFMPTTRTLSPSRELAKFFQLLSEKLFQNSRLCELNSRCFSLPVWLELRLEKN